MTWKYRSESTVNDGENVLTISFADDPIVAERPKVCIPSGILRGAQVLVPSAVARDTAEEFTAIPQSRIVGVIADPIAPVLAQVIVTPETLS